MYVFSNLLIKCYCQEFETTNLDANSIENFFNCNLIQKYMNFLIANTWDFWNDTLTIFEN
jgi:hypothetical protein